MPSMLGEKANRNCLPILLNLGTLTSLFSFLEGSFFLSGTSIPGHENLSSATSSPHKEFCISAELVLVWV